MGRPIIRVEKIGIKPDRSGGTVTYEIRYPDGRYSFMAQPFVRGAHIQGYWGWDGNEPVSLTPSFRCLDPLMGVEAHLYLTDGEIELCSDSTVTKEPTDA